MSRLSGLVQKKIGGEDPDDTMQDIMEALGTESQGIPEVGKYYTFVYSPKTPNIQYDEFPLVAVTEIFSWGFRGLNYHWPGFRQYTYPEIVEGIYNIEDGGELEDAKRLSYGKKRLNN